MALAAVMAGGCTQHWEELGESLPRGCHGHMVSRSAVGCVLKSALVSIEQTGNAGG